jgi:hypothetical protein
MRRGPTTRPPPAVVCAGDVSAAVTWRYAFGERAYVDEVTLPVAPSAEVMRTRAIPPGLSVETAFTTKARAMSSAPARRLVSDSQSAP